MHLRFILSSIKSAMTTNQDRGETIWETQAP
jgi:hypothetical protein